MEPTRPLPFDMRLALLVALAVCCAIACGAPPPPEVASASRDTRWAEPLVRDGLPNLARIEPDLYRGAQPEPAGLAALREMGVRTIVNLRWAHSDRDEVKAAGLADDAFDLIEIPMLASQPDLERTRAFLAVAADPAQRPLFFHCKHGADRTGAMAAAYRIVVQGWTADDAIAEMTGGGFGFHPVFRGLPDFVAALPAARLREGLGPTR